MRIKYYCREVLCMVNLFVSILSWTIASMIVYREGEKESLSRQSLESETHLWEIIMNIRLSLFLVMLALFAIQVSCKKTEPKTGDIKGNEHDAHKNKLIINITNEQRELIGLKTETLNRKVVSHHLNATAKIQFNANKLFHIGPRIKGRVVAIFADLGDDIMEGKKLAILDSIELGEARTKLIKTKTKMEVAHTNYERGKKLWEKKISSEKEIHKARGDYFIAKAEFEAAENKLHLLGFSEDDIRSTISQSHTKVHFPILSPYKGTVIEKHITLGALTNPEETLFVMADLDALWIVLNIYEKDLVKINLGQEAEVKVSAFPDEEFKGQISYISNVVEEATRTVKVRVVINNSKRMLKPGMFATAQIATSDPQEIFTVPLSAIQKLQNKRVVFIHRGDGLFESSPIKTGREFETDIELLEGIEKGEEVVTQGAFYLKSELLKDTLEVE